MADILVVDDDTNLGLAMQMALTQAGHQCRLAENAEAGWREFQRRVPDLALLDLRLPDSDGLQLMARIQENNLRVPVVIMTGFGTVTTAVAALKGGAADYIEKPLSVKEICALVRQMLEDNAITRHVRRNESADDNQPRSCPLIAESAVMKQVLSLADRIAALPSTAAIGLNTTLITGETGTGKEMLARYIHDHGPRRDKPFIHVNCTAVPENLFESELFGHERGAFTDAKTAKAGLFEAAHGGTLFLDEIGDIPLAMQGKLLVALESGRVRRVGATAEQKVDIRVIAATNKKLDDQIRAGTFRPDLYHRLKLFHIDLPPLRKRGDDVVLLGRYFLASFSEMIDKPVPQVPPETWSILRGYAWPGNVRELAHVLLRGLVVCDGGTLQPSDLALPAADTGGIPSEAAHLQIDLSQGEWTLAEVEKKLLQAAMERAGGNIAEAARLLRMPRATLRYRLEKLGLLSESESGAAAGD